MKKGWVQRSMILTKKEAKMVRRDLELIREKLSPEEWIRKRNPGRSLSQTLPKKKSIGA